MKIGSRVYVSLMSRSKLAGECGTLISGAQSGSQRVVRNDFGVTGYIIPCHVVEIDTDSYNDEDVVLLADEQEDKTDLLCKTVRFELPVDSGFNFEQPDGKTVFKIVQAGRGVWGRVSDQWYENGIELLNVVFCGTYAVIPSNWVSFVQE